MLNRVPAVPKSTPSVKPLLNMPHSTINVRTKSQLSIMAHVQRDWQRAPPDCCKKEDHLLLPFSLFYSASRFCYYRDERMTKAFSFHILFKTVGIGKKRRNR